MEAYLAALLYSNACCYQDCCSSPYKVKNKEDMRKVFEGILMAPEFWKKAFKDWTAKSDSLTRALRSAIRHNIVEESDDNIVEANVEAFKKGTGIWSAFNEVQEVAPFCGPLYCTAYCGNCCRSRSPQMRFAEYLVLYESAPVP